jgi:hypothetical protein
MIASRRTQALTLVTKAIILAQAGGSATSVLRTITMLRCGIGFSEALCCDHFACSHCQKIHRYEK